MAGHVTTKNLQAKEMFGGTEGWWSVLIVAVTNLVGFISLKNS